MIKILDLTDIDQANNLFLDVFSSPPWNDEWTSPKHSKMYVLELMSAPNSFSLGFFQDNKLIGLSLGHVYTWWQGKEYHIKEFCIAKEVQKQSYGTRFIQAIEKLCIDHNHKAILLPTEKDVPAFHFYLKQGYRTLENSVFMVKALKK